MGSSRSHKKTHFRHQSPTSGSSAKVVRRHRRRSRDYSLPDAASKRVSHKSKDSKSGSNRTALRKVAKRVHRMVDGDMQHKSTAQTNDEETTQSIIPDCGCPHSCGPELQKLREYIGNLSPLIETSLINMYELDQLVDAPERLLSETWTTIGASGLQELVPEDLLAICARREKRGSKHCSDSYYASTLSVTQSLPPFKSFCTSPSQSDCGVTEFWRRCLFELFELSPDEIKLVLSGTGDLNLIQPPHYELSSEPQPRKQSIELPPLDSRFPSHSDHVAPSVEPTKLVTDNSVSQHEDVVSIAPPRVSPHGEKCSPEQQKFRVQQEIVELEMRARAIRSMLGSRSKSSSK